MTFIWLLSRFLYSYGMLHVIGISWLFPLILFPPPRPLCRFNIGFLSLFRAYSPGRFAGLPHLGVAHARQFLAQQLLVVRPSAGADDPPRFRPVRHPPVKLFEDRHHC